MLGVAIRSASSLTLGTGSLSSDHIRNNKRKKEKKKKKVYLPVVTHFTARARGSPSSSSLGETAGDHWEKRQRRRIFKKGVLASAGALTPIQCGWVSWVLGKSGAGTSAATVHREAGVGVATVFVEASRDKDGCRRLINTEG